MTAPVFDLAAARTNTPSWPPLDGDIWTDRNGGQWATHLVIHNRTDAVMVAFHKVNGSSRCLPSYALEKYGPLALHTKGYARIAFEQLPAEQQAQHAAYLASRCTFCGPEGATGPECYGCVNDLEFAA